MTMTINWIDLGIIIIMLLNIIRGVRRGIIRGITNFIGIVAAIFLAIFWFKEAGEYISLYFPTLSREISNLIGFVAIFLGVLLIARIVEIFLKKIFSFLFISWIDKLGGVLLGFLRGLLITELILVILTFIPLPGFIDNQLEESFLADRFAVILINLYGHLQDWLPASFQFNTEELLQKFYLNLF